MPPTRKSIEDYDSSTPDGRAKLSLLRNRGAQRMIDRVKDYQKASQHKVLLNFIPTWPGGKPKVWLSHPPEEFTPLKIDTNQNIVPFESNQVYFPFGFNSFSKLCFNMYLPEGWIMF